MQRRIPLLVFALAAAPVFAQVDLSGEWNPLFTEDQPERIPGPEIGDYLGLPITDAARMRGDIWDASILTMPEHQCKPHPSDYGIRGPANLRISKEIDRDTQQLIAWHTHISWMAPERTIWMDGRPHPPDYAPHTWQGFSTGKWDGNILTVTTTHLKIGWIRRNGIPRSDRATVTEHFIRHDDNHLTVVTIVDDPVYLSEPFMRSTDFFLDLNQQIAPYPCESVEEVVRDKGVVPAHLPGSNPFLSEFPNRFKLPALAARGGAGTMYPEYAKAIHDPSQHNIEGQTGAPRSAPKPDLDSDDIRVLPVQSSAHAQVYMLLGPGGNTTVQAGDDGVLVVDSQYMRSSDRLLAEIKKLSRKPIRYVVNTSIDEAHTGGNEALSKAGSTITGGNVAGANAGWPATIVAQENVLDRMSAATGSAAIPSDAWPVDIYREDRKDMYFNGEAVQLFHQPAAHTDGDSIVFFRKSDVISTGDLFTPGSYPVIDIARGGSINGVVDALNRILDLTVPAEKQEGGTMVVPGHGRLCDEADVVEYRDMMTIIRERLRDMVKKGMTLEQVKAAKPTRDFDPLYGAASGPWTTDMFVEAAYKSLTKK
ncbi:MAG TPA: MBL fold metallo-hydrolase [Bryobacteraceae bacterium]|jgi:glyoxylase-like metal-dependent hydrolase (beta-lactamase superfamily II)